MEKNSTKLSLFDRIFFGILSIFLSWIDDTPLSQWEVFFESRHVNVIDILSGRLIWITGNFLIFVGLMIFLIGILVDFFTTIGSIIQSIGFGIFFLSSSEYMGTYAILGIPSGTLSYGIGFYIGLLSIIIIYISIFMPHLSFTESRNTHLRERLLTWHRKISC